MSSVDERVVRMRFDNGAFHNGVKATLDDLKNLTQGLKLNGAGKGLEEISKTAGRFSLANMGQQIQGVLGQFSALQVAAVTALATIANKAVTAGAQLASSFTLKPIADGLAEYETNMNSIQTVLANTGLKGAEGLAKVNGALGELNTYSDQTIYNFSEMAKNIGTFTAAGVDLDTSTAAIKGIANLAAVSGSNAQQASTAMYQLSQALATGKVSLMDWNSVVNAGMGGKVFQDALKETARVQGVAIDDIIKKNGSFRDSLQEGWLTSDILTKTLSKFTGDLTAEQLKSMGYNQEQIAGILEMGKTAQDAATKVKTVSQLIGTLQEAAGSGWTQTWQLVFGDFDEAKTLFTNVSNVLGGMINASATARNKVISDWKALGGRDLLIQGLSNAFDALMAVIKPVSDAFKQIFPPATGAQLFAITKAIADFTANLKIGGTTADNLRRTFAGFFAILGLGWEVIKAAGSALLDLLGVATGGSGSFLEFTAGIGDFLVALLEATKRGEGLKKFFDGLATAIAGPIRLIKAIAAAFAGLFKGADFSGLGKSFGDLLANGISLEGLGKVITDIWTSIINIFDKVAGALDPIIGKIKDFFANLGDDFTNTFGKFDYQTFLATIDTGLLGGLLLLLKNFAGSLLSIDVGGSFFSSLTEGFDSLTDTLGGMQSTLKAATLFGIAAAILLLASALAMLSHIDSDGLIRGSAAIGVLFAQLIGATAAFAAIGTFKQFAKLPLIGVGLILIAAALKILADAVVQLSGLDWEALATGLTGVLTLLAGMAGAVKLMAGQGPGMVAAGAGLVLVAAAIKILVGAVQDFSALSWEEIAKGLTGVGALLASLAIFTRLQEANAGSLASSVGILILAAAIKVLASAVQDFATMSWEELGKGLAGVAGGLLIIAGALKLIPPTSLLSAAAVFVVAASLGMIGDAISQMGGLDWSTIGKGLVTLAGALGLIAAALALLPPSSLLSAAAIFVVAASLGMITDALGTMGGMTWGEIAKGLVTLAGSLAIIAGALYLMTAALPGALALAVVAGSLALLGPVLVSFSGLSWEGIAKSMVVLAGAFTILGVAGILLTPMVPTLLALGAAVLLLGVGAMAAGAGVLLFSAGLAALAASGAGAAAAIVAIVTGILGILPTVAKQLGLAIIAFAKVIATAGPAMIKAITVVLDSLLQAVIDVLPKLEEAINKLVQMIINVLVTNIPKLVDAGLKIVIGILTGVRNNIGQIVTVAGQIIVNFLNGLSAALPKIIQAGINLVISLVNGVANGIRNNQSAMQAAGSNLAGAIVQGMVSGIGKGIGSVVSAAKQLANSALNAAKSALGIHSPSKKFIEVGEFTAQGFAKGLTGSRSEIDDAVKAMTDKLQDAVESNTTAIGDAEEKLNKLTEARNEDTKAILDQNQAVLDAREKDNESIKDAETKLAKLRSARKKDTAAITKAEKELADAQKRQNEADAVTKLQELTKARDKDTAAIQDATKSLAELREEQSKYTAAQQAMSIGIAQQQVRLDGLADKLAGVKDKLEAANKVLDDAVKTRNDYNKSITEQYDALPDIGGEVQLGDFVSQLKKQISDVTDYTTALQKARVMGLNDQLYKELLSKGTSAMPFVQQLLAGGQDAITEVNSLGSQLAKASGDLGIRAAKELYQSGIYSAVGIVSGLQAQQSEIEGQMETIANSMVKTINRRLGIHSPSQVMSEVGSYSGEGLANGLKDSAPGVNRASAGLGGQIISGLTQGMANGIPSVISAAVQVAQGALTAAKNTLGVHSPSREFAAIGQWSSQGLANGLTNYSGRVVAASSSIGKDAITALSKSISGMQDILGSDVDLNPVITPVLDLSEVQKNAASMSTLLAAQPISVNSAYLSAKNASAGYQSNVETRDQVQASAQPTPSITYIQNNTSPVALSPATIYRQTKNQLSVAKGALPTSAKQN